MSALSVHFSTETEPCPVRFNFARYVVGEAALRWPDKAALIVVDGAVPDKALETWNFTEVDNAVRRAAGAMVALGLERGDRVLIRIGDTPLFPVAYFGVIAAGGVAVPLSSQLSAEELSYIAADADPRFAVLDRGCPTFSTEATRIAPDALDGEPLDYVDMAADDPAQLVYTSGTSGKPKGVLHAQRSVWARRMMRRGWHDMQESDRVMHTGAFNWTYVLGCGLSDPWSVGATAILNAGDRAPDVWPKLARHWRPTVFASVPGLYRRMLKYADGLGEGFADLRHGLTAGEALSPGIRDGWHAATGKPLYESLGMSEVSTFISSGPHHETPDGAMGNPQPGRHVGVLGDDGEPVPLGESGVLAVHRSDLGLMLGYWRDDARTRAAFSGDWFLTGDRAVMHEGGALTYLGRDDDMMNAQGYRVAPQEVEAVLLLHPFVSECGVSEVAIEDGLSIISAWVVADEVVDADALRDHCALHLAGYKIPRAFHRIEALPRTANGKVQRRALATVQAVSL